MKAFVALCMLICAISMAAGAIPPEETIKFIVNSGVSSRQRSAGPASPLLPISNKNASARISFGDNVPVGKYGFAAFVYGKNFVCSGTLISARVVLTAGHCVYGEDGWYNSPSAIRVRIGDVDPRKSTEHNVKTMIIPEYNVYSNYGDLALLLLATASDETPVTLPPSTLTVTDYPKLIAVGFGYMEDDELADVLQQVPMSVLSKANCDLQHKQWTGKTLPKDHFCTGLDPGFESTCSGDSGGPYLIPSDPPVQVGLVSYGPGDYECGKEGNLDVPTSIIYWSDWIKTSLSVYNMRGTTVPKRLNKLLKDKCYTGAAMKSVTAADAGQCCEACRVLKSCKAWTWTTAKTCALLKSKGKTKSSAKQCVSGYY